MDITNITGYNQPIQDQYAQQPQPQFQGQTPLLNAIDWLLSSPSIPIALRKQFYALWENVIFGNYSENDIKYLMSKFREWAIMLKWYIPEQRWGNILSYRDVGDESPIIESDLNMLLNNLEQLFYINLTRGKGGFTVKELTTIRTFYTQRSEDQMQPRKRFSIF